MYSRHTYRSLQQAEFGAARKAALQKPKREDKRRSPSVERSYKEIADFLSFLPDDPFDAEPAAAEVVPQDDTTPRMRPRRGIDAQSDTESLVSHVSRARRGSDAQSDTESAFSRGTQPRRKAFDAQSDTESNVFSRLTRPRQSAGPPRTTSNIENGKSGSRAGALRRSTSQIEFGSSSFRAREDFTNSVESDQSHRSKSGKQSANFERGGSLPARKKGTRQASLRHSTSQIDFSDGAFSDNASLEGFRLPSSRAQDDKGNFRLSSRALEYEDYPEEASFVSELGY
jgi:hypothetical protein